MAVPIDTPTGDTTVTRVDFDVVKARAAKVLEIPLREVTDARLAKLFKTSRKSIGRYKRGCKPRFERALAMARTLGLTVEEITASPTGGDAE